MAEPDTIVAEPVVEPSAEPTSIVNPDGTFTEDWSKKYGDENQAHLSRYKDIDSLVNSHINTKKKFGKNPDSLIEMPTDTSSDEVKAAWRKANGVPDTLEEYEYKLSDEMAVKLGPLNDEKMSSFREFANEQGLNKGQFTSLLDFYHNMLSAQADKGYEAFDKQRAETAEAAKAELRKQPGWQSEAEYKDKIDTAQLIMDKYDLAAGVKDLNLQNSPQMVIGLNKIADSMSEDTLKGLKTTSVVTNANLKSQVNDIREQMNKIQKENPVNFKVNAKYKELLERKHELYKQYPA